MTECQPGGKFFLSTLNRTPQSYLAAIIGAEYLLGLLDVGTHDWNKFVTPKEVENAIAEIGTLHVEDIAGMFYNPLTSSASLIKDTSVNYIMCIGKEKE